MVMMKYSFDTSLGNLTQRISKSLGLRLVSKLESHDISITAEQWCIISMLKFQRQATQTAIGLFLGYDKVRVLRLIEGLERVNIIERSTDNNDKRFKNVKLTELGNQYYSKIEVHAKKTLEEATNGLSREELNSCISTLKKITGNLETDS
jgi:MarR family transcriptional regulator, organic hydroperoxide resistance regulator